MPSREDPLVTSASVEDVVAAIEAVDLEAPWSRVAPDLRIALPRRRPLPPGVDGLPQREYPPGIIAGLGLDIGPAMLFVNQQQLARWGVSNERAFEQALANVHAKVEARSHFALVHEAIGGVPTLAFQSREGWAASLVLLPADLVRVFGARDGILLAPMRDLLMLLPLEGDPSLALDILEEFAEVDMNVLDLPILALLDGRLSVAVDPRSRAAGRARRMH